MGDEDEQDDEIGYYTVLTDPRFAKAAWIGASTMAFAQLTGINSIIFYSSQIFADSGISPFVAQAIINSVNCVATVFSMVVLTYVGKKPTILFA